MGVLSAMCSCLAGWQQQLLLCCLLVGRAVHLPIVWWVEPIMVEEFVLGRHLCPWVLPLSLVLRYCLCPWALPLSLGASFVFWVRACLLGEGVTCALV